MSGSVFWFDSISGKFLLAGARGGVGRLASLDLLLRNVYHVHARARSPTRQTHPPSSRPDPGKLRDRLHGLEPPLIREPLPTQLGLRMLNGIVPSEILVCR